jgi:hypothetical protein
MQPFMDSIYEIQRPLLGNGYNNNACTNKGEKKERRFLLGQADEKMVKDDFWRSVPRSNK